jgi:hypothetical protein
LSNCDRELQEIYEMMLDVSKEHKTQIRLIESIPGIGELSALYIIAEISTDLSSFRTSKHIAAWAGLAPKDYESAGKLKYSKTKKANIYIKSILVECAWAAIKRRNTRLSNWYWSNVSRLGEKKAIIAVARKLLICIYAMLKSGEMYNDSLDKADTERRKAKKLESALKIVEHRQDIQNAKTHDVIPDSSGVVTSTIFTKPEEGTSTEDQINCKTVDMSAPTKKRGQRRKTKVDENKLGSYSA